MGLPAGHEAALLILAMTHPHMTAPQRYRGLIEIMARLPGLGPRSARRAVLHLIKKRGTLMAPLADAMGRVADSARDLPELRQHLHRRPLPDLPR
jgi:Holliday junction resolvasome RuvABC DNA-binding subunit